MVFHSEQVEHSTCGFAWTKGSRRVIFLPKSMKRNLPTSYINLARNDSVVASREPSYNADGMHRSVLLRS